MHDFDEKELRLAELLAALPHDDKRKQVVNLMSLAAGMEPHLSVRDVDFLANSKDLRSKAKAEGARLVNLYQDLQELVGLILGEK